MPSISAAMRVGSRAEHEAAESSPFLAELMDGHVGPSRYAGYLARLRLVYAALEEVGRTHRDDPWVAAVHDPALERLPTVGRLLRLRQTHGDERLEAACARALAFDDPRYATIKGILVDGSEHEPLVEALAAIVAFESFRAEIEAVVRWRPSRGRATPAASRSTP